ncbi:MAG: FecR domain-containing protein [Novosphingobium sp.]|nr:FecR domain-containing protein [Novosphingobium sp.]
MTEIRSLRAEPLAPIDFDDLEPTQEMVAAAVQQHLRIARLAGRRHAAALAAYAKWQAATPAHFVAAKEVEVLLEAALPAAQALARSDRRGVPHRWRRIGPHLRRFAARTALAASLALATLAGWSQRDAATRWTSDASAYDAPSQIALADGTRILLNGRTALDYDLRPGQRDVTMKMGEAWFDVAHDPARPFRIATPEGTIRVVGTAFNVRLGDRQTVVTVDRGIVRVAPEHAPGHAILLKVGQQALFDATAVQRQPGYDAEATSAWRRGRLLFYDAPLADVVAELNRYRAAPILILGDPLRRRPISGLFRTFNTDSAIDTIERTLHVSVTRLPGGFVILS